MHYFDAHTHGKSKKSAIYCMAHLEQSYAGFFSAGIHPWKADSINCTEAIAYLESFNKTSNFVAVGEIGLDRACGADFDKQVQIFKCQLNWAEQQNLPVIIHAVRSYSDILQLFKQSRPTVPVIFHAYRGNKQISTQLMQWNSYFSFGENTLNPKYIESIPMNRIFAETDESALPLTKIYETLSKLFDITPQKLNSEIGKNAEKIFGINLLD